MDIKIEKLAAMRRPESKLTIPNIDPLTETVSGEMQNTREFDKQKNGLSTASRTSPSKYAGSLSL